MRLCHYSHYLPNMVFCLANINYRAIADIESHQFKIFVEQNNHHRYRNVGGMICFTCSRNIKLIVFPSNGKCRIMGCKSPFNETRDAHLIPFPLQSIQLQSVTVSFKLQGGPVILHKLSAYCYAKNIKYIYEAELFPALRLTCFNPLCVNVFGTGKCVITGIKDLCYINAVQKVIKLINASRAFDSLQ